MAATQLASLQVSITQEGLREAIAAVNMFLGGDTPTVSR